MSNSVQDANGMEQVKEDMDTQMESPAGKGKGKMAEEMPVDESGESEEEEEVSLNSVWHQIVLITNGE